jgi:hypothetical protein
MVPKPSTVQPADVGPKKTPFQRGNRTENRTGRAYGVSEIRHTSAKRGRNLDIRLGPWEGITDPWPTPSAAVRRSAQRLPRRAPYRSWTWLSRQSAKASARRLDMSPLGLFMPV